MRQGLRFWKLDAGGNDFVLVEAARVGDAPGLARQLCPRRSGVGADGLLVVERGLRPRVVHYDPDGSRSFCLNALRAVACWLRGRGEAGARLTLETDAGSRPIVDDAVWAPAAAGRQDLRVEGVRGSFVDVGNPQFVVELPDLEALEHPALMERGARLRWHPRFPQGTNVTFALRRGAEVHVRTYERGVEGETLACGTGVVAAASVLLTAPRATFVTRGGARLEVALERDAAGRLQGVWSSGPAKLVSWGRVPAPPEDGHPRAAA
ncbi:MAG: diaminopimelate epimerase [Planctomycetes bacterium]|nr:diaminopimelate epimerase [Planctomycetota bacterium]